MLIALSCSPGTWHHPMITLDQITDYSVFVHENGTDGDCEVQLLPEIFRCEVPDTL